MQSSGENEQLAANQEVPSFSFNEESGIANDHAASDHYDRRQSDEWDASKVPPSRFQKRKGSIYATPNSRDGHIDRNVKDKYHARIAEMASGGRRKSKDATAGTSPP